MNFPKTLKKGHTLGMVAPASSVANLDIDGCVRSLNELGYQVKLGKSIGQKLGFLSGDDDTRAGDINDMFRDPSIDGIICLRGGYGSQRLLSKIDWDLVKRNPKAFIGFSDITAIHINLNQKSDLITFHGPMVNSSLLGNKDDHMVDSLMDAMALKDYKNPEGRNLERVVGGQARGRLVGGNLTLIGALMGTPYEIDTVDKILVIEDVGKETFRLDRLLVQLRQAGKLDHLKGILVGDFKNCDDKGDQSLDDLIEDHFVGLDIPVIKNLAVGHCKPMSSLPLGAMCYMDADAKKISFGID